MLISSLSDNSNKGSKAYFYMLIAMFLFASVAIFIRLSTDIVHVFQAIFFRNLFGLPMIFLLYWKDFSILKTNRVALHSIRAVLSIAAMATGFAAVSLIPLADAAALGFTTPLIATVAAGLILREPIGFRKIGCVCLSSFGVFLIISPQFENLSIGVWLALTSAILTATLMLLVKMLSTTDLPETIFLWTALLQTPLSFILALFVWQPIDSIAFLWLLCLAIAGNLAHLFWIKAYTKKDVSQLQPFEFIKLPIIAMAGFIFFGEAMRWEILIGGLIIFASASFVTYNDK